MCVCVCLGAQVISFESNLGFFLEQRIQHYFLQVRDACRARTCSVVTPGQGGLPDRLHLPVVAPGIAAQLAPVAISLTSALLTQGSSFAGSAFVRIHYAVPVRYMIAES